MSAAVASSILDEKSAIEFHALTKEIEMAIPGFVAPAVDDSHAVLNVGTTTHASKESLSSLRAMLLFSKTMARVKNATLLTGVQNF